MKFGLVYRNGKLVAEYGGVGEYIQDSLPDDVYLLEDILTGINQEPVGYRIQKEDYRYLVVDKDIVTAIFYDEFEEEEINMGFFYLKDLLGVIRSYIDLLREEDCSKYRRIDAFYSKLNDVLSARIGMIKHLRRTLTGFTLMLAEGKEQIGDVYIYKSYKVQFEGDRILVEKNRQFEREEPIVFSFKDGNSQSFFDFFTKDIDQWFAEKMNKAT